MLKESDEVLSGNDRFEGFVFDIIDEISKMLGFHYQFKLVDDGKYGSINKETGEWNGMIRELLDGVSWRPFSSSLPSDLDMADALILPPTPHQTLY